MLRTIELRKSNGTQCFLLRPPHPPLSPILGERIKVRGHELSIRRSIIYTNLNNCSQLYLRMLTRRNLIKTFLLSVLLSSSSVLGLLLKFTKTTWAEAKKILPKGFSRNQLKDMNPADIDSRNLETDPLDQFGTMGPTEVAVDLKNYRLKITGEVGHPLSLSYDQILKYPSLTETVLLICPGFFSNNGFWAGVHLRVLLQEAKIKKEAKYIDVKGAHEKLVRIPLQDIDKKRIFLAYRVNPVRNSSGALAALSRRRSGLNPAGIVLKCNPAAEHRSIISNGVNGKTLPQKHGFPLRLVYEDSYGYDWVKYVEGIVVS